jgi:hypothetical protein
MSKKKKRTAAELMAQLTSDLAFVARRAKQDEEHEQRAAELRRAEIPIVEELRDNGYAVESVWDFVNTTTSYTKAIPIFLAHLCRPYPSAVREGIARALAVPEARISGWGTLTRLYRDEQDTRAKDGLAVAIAGAANDDVIGEVVALARDPRHGGSRLLLLSALERSADPRARIALMDLRTDADLKKEIQVILRRVDRRQR